MKKILKRIALWFSIAAVSPVLVGVSLGRLVWGEKRAFESGAQWLAMIPGNLGNALRGAYYYCRLASFDPTARICMGSVICDPRSEIGSHVYIGTFCEMGWVSIGKDTLIASRVMIPSGKRVHHYEDLAVPIRMQGGSPECVVVGEDCWVGTGCIVMANVGDKAVVGAGAVVVKQLPPASLSVGNPARVLRMRSGTPDLEPGSAS